MTKYSALHHKQLRDCMIVYTGGTIKPQLVITNNIFKDSNQICNGFEVVYFRTLYDVFPNAVFICCDDYRHIANPITNIVGTMLYGTGYKIMGTICIVNINKGIDGDDFVGLTLNEANQICEVIKRRL